MPNRDVHAALKQIPLLRGLPVSVAHRLLDGAELIAREADQILFQEGGRPDCLFAMLRGSVQLYAGDEGRETVIGIMRPPEVFMAPAALFEEPYLVSARTLSPARLLLLRAGAFRDEARASPELAWRLTSLLAGHWRMALRQIRDLKLRTCSERLAGFLLRLLEEQGGTGYADLPAPKSVLASRLGLSPETLSRALGLLREHGLEVRGSRVILMDRRRLEAFCPPDPLIDSPDTNLQVTAL